MKSKQSKHNQIKAHLESGRALTGPQAWSYYGIWRLSSVINRLRNKGMKIKTTIITGNSAYQYGIYSIID